LYGMIAGYQYWFPKAFGFRLNERWGRIAFVCWVAGFYLAFMPLYVLGAMGMARRTEEVFQDAYIPWLVIAEVGAFVLLAGLAALFVQLYVSIRQRADNRVFAGDPWDGRGLEWSVSAPPPEYNFAVIPFVQDRDTFAGRKERSQAYKRPHHFHDIELPGNSAVGVVIGIAGAACAFALVWHIWWLAIVGLLTIWGAVIARSFVRDVYRIVPASEVARTEDRWLSAVAATRAIPRELEETSANRGLAEQTA
jgi:cytochrome o ubiquinol oxidase subunit 1